MCIGRGYFPVWGPWVLEYLSQPKPRSLVQKSLSVTCHDLLNFHTLWMRRAWLWVCLKMVDWWMTRTVSGEFDQFWEISENLNMFLGDTQLSNMNSFNMNGGPDFLLPNMLGNFFSRPLWWASFFQPNMLVNFFSCPSCWATFFLPRPIGSFFPCTKYWAGLFYCLAWIGQAFT